MPDKLKASALWVVLFSGGLVLAVLLLNYVNKVFLVTYELQGNATFTFSSDRELKQFQERFALKAKQENAHFIFKSTDGYIGSSLSSASPFKYQFQNFGYCNIRTCVDASNGFEPNTFDLYYYDNWLVPGDNNNEIRSFIEATKRELLTRK